MIMKKCKYCKVEQNIGYSKLTSITKHEIKCKSATKEERAFYKASRRWPSSMNQKNLPFYPDCAKIEKAILKNFPKGSRFHHGGCDIGHDKKTKTVKVSCLIVLP